MFQKAYGSFVMTSQSPRRGDRMFKGIVELQKEGKYFYISKYNPKLQWYEINCEDNIVNLDVYSLFGEEDTGDAKEYYTFIEEVFTPPFNYMSMMVENLQEKLKNIEVEVIEKSEDTFLRIKMKNTGWMTLRIPQKEYWVRPLKEGETYIFKISYYYTKEGTYINEKYLIPTHMYTKYVSIPAKSSKVIEQKFASEKYI